MNLVTNLLNLISSGLLIPVIVLLLLLFVGALLQIGGFFGSYARRMRSERPLSELISTFRAGAGSSRDLESIRRDRVSFSQAIETMLDTNWDSIHSEKAIAEFELACHRFVETPRTMMRIGPMLGLMGTLIPMGPALVGLAAGDIAAMAVNMQVAFATTVIGLFIGAIGFAVQQVRQRWANQDLQHLIYLFELGRRDHEGNSASGEPA